VMLFISGQRRGDDETVTRDVARSAQAGWPHDTGSRVRDRSGGRQAIRRALPRTCCSSTRPDHGHKRADAALDQSRPGQHHEDDAG
jgi:hypothetical protein